MAAYRPALFLWYNTEILYYTEMEYPGLPLSNSQFEQQYLCHYIKDKYLKKNNTVKTNEYIRGRRDFSRGKWGGGGSF